MVERARTKEELPQKRCYLHRGVTMLRQDQAIVRQFRQGYVLGDGLKAAVLH